MFLFEQGQILLPGFFPGRVGAAKPIGSFAEHGSNWFRRPDTPGEKAWQQDLSLLEQEHRLLREALTRFDPAKLHNRKTVKGRPLIDYILGISFHDIYHAGQIRLLRRLQ